MNKVAPNSGCLIVGLLLLIFLMIALLGTLFFFRRGIFPQRASSGPPSAAGRKTTSAWRTGAGNTSNVRPGGGAKFSPSPLKDLSELWPADESTDFPQANPSSNGENEADQTVTEWISEHLINAPYKTLKYYPVIRYRKGTSFLVRKNIFMRGPKGKDWVSKDMVFEVDGSSVDLLSNLDGVYLNREKIFALELSPDSPRIMGAQEGGK